MEYYKIVHELKTVDQFQYFSASSVIKKMFITLNSLQITEVFINLKSC
jgi:hypothetical protein